MLIGANVLAADIYEFKQDWDPKPAQTQAAPKKSTPAKTTPAKTTPAQSSEQDDSKTAEQSDAAAKPVPKNAVVHYEDCAHGVHCNDL